MKSLNPATGEVLKTFDAYTNDQVDAILIKADEGFLAHKKTSFSDRKNKMKNAARILLDKKGELASLMVLEMGKPIAAAISEIEKCADLCEYYADHAEKFLQDKHIESDFQESYVRYLPIGAVLAVMPWNFPFWQVFRFAVPALMAGNVGLLKHASNVPQCALAIEKIFKDAGFTEGAFQTLLIESKDVERIIADDRVRAVTLTGSEKAGQSVARQAGQNIKKSVMELGGSDPFIVMPSADLSKAVNWAVKGRVQNNGQTCIAAKRFIVHEDIYDDFRAQLIEKFEALKVGNPMDEDSDIGPLATESIRKDLDEQVKESIEKGATKLCGATVVEGDGYYYQPGLLENIPKDSPAYSEELFGPVGLLFRFSDLTEAVEIANDTRFGLGSVIYSQEENDINYAIDNLDAGATFINGIVASNPRLPFGGVKYSGYGRELSIEGLLEFMNTKTIVRV